MLRHLLDRFLGVSRVKIVISRSVKLGISLTGTIRPSYLAVTFSGRPKQDIGIMSTYIVCVEVAK